MNPQQRFKRMRDTLRCRSCASLLRPGMSDGYCSNELRSDLPPAYTPGHPLRRLPANGGRDCIAYQPAAEIIHDYTDTHTDAED